MNITSVKVVIRDTDTKLAGKADIVLDNMVVIKEIKILFTGEKYFLAMPSRSTIDGGHKDIVHPINEAARKVFEDAILYAYKKAKESGYKRVSLELKNMDAPMFKFDPEEYEINYSNEYIIKETDASDAHPPFQKIKETKDLHPYFPKSKKTKSKDRKPLNDNNSDKPNENEDTDEENLGDWINE